MNISIGKVILREEPQPNPFSSFYQVVGIIETPTNLFNSNMLLDLVGDPENGFYINPNGKDYSKQLHGIPLGNTLSFKHMWR